MFYTDTLLVQERIWIHPGVALDDSEAEEEKASEDSEECFTGVCCFCVGGACGLRAGWAWR